MTFKKIDYIITSPIINHRNKDVNPIIEKAKNSNVKIISDLELDRNFQFKKSENRCNWEQMENQRLLNLSNQVYY